MKWNLLRQHTTSNSENKWFLRSCFTISYVLYPKYKDNRSVEPIKLYFKFCGTLLLFILVTIILHLIVLNIKHALKYEKKKHYCSSFNFTMNNTRVHFEALLESNLTFKNCTLPEESISLNHSNSLSFNHTKSKIQNYDYEQNTSNLDYVTKNIQVKNIKMLQNFLLLP